MRSALEGVPDLIWGRPWSSLVPGRIQDPLERLAADHLYRSLPPPVFRIRGDAPAATLLVTGDLALHRWSERVSPEEVFGGVRGLLDSADFTVVNLETVLTSEERQAGRIGRFLKASPAAVSCLKYLGVTAASSANNHALDFRGAGLAECGRVLRQAGIEWCGTDEGANQAIAGGFSRQVNGVIVGVLAATDHFGGVPDADGPSPVWVDAAALRRNVRALRAACHVVLVQLHWGYERVMYPLRWHRDLARDLIDEGADLVCCHHAHVVMGVERWGRGVVAHGLGNFYGFGGRRHPLGRFGLVLRAAVDAAGLVAADVVTVRTETDGGVTWEEKACPGFHRLCARLTHDDYLERIERARVAHALADMATELRTRIDGGDVEGLVERHAYLQAPRQEWLVTTARRAPSPLWRQIGSWLSDFRSLPVEAVRRLAIPAPPDARGLHRFLDRRLVPGRLP